MSREVTDEDLDLLDELGVDTTAKEKSGRSAREERIIAGFEEILRFYEQHQRLPENRQSADIFERIYAVRLESIRRSHECCILLEEWDRFGMLSQEEEATSVVNSGEVEYDAKLLDDLGMEEHTETLDITDLRHVRTRQEIRAAEEIAQRAKCLDFAAFSPLFALVQEQLRGGIRKTLKFQENAEVTEGEFFILDGQKVYVAKVGEKFTNDYDRIDSRLRLIFDNGTESDMLLRSFQRALYKDEASRRITTPDHGPLFSQVESETDSPSGYIYVLRSLSDNAFIAEHREVIHKIGLTSRDVKRRIGNAKKESTYLLAEVETVATYKLANLDAKNLEIVLHRFFAEARLDLSLQDRFGTGVEPREWFLVPLSAIQEAVEKLMEGRLHQYLYDKQSASIIKNISDAVES